VLVANAHGAAPKPWQWTPGLASHAVVAAHLAVFPSSTGDTGEITSATCVGEGPGTSARFSAFRCAVSVFFNGKPVRKATLWVKVRKVGTGQVCANLKNFAAIPPSCLSRSGAPRLADGTTLHAWYALREAMTVRMGTPTRWVAGIRCLGYGAGFYTCAFEKAERGEASVTLTTEGPVALTAFGCP
jgi:hypothetical protein